MKRIYCATCAILIAFLWMGCSGNTNSDGTNPASAGANAAAAVSTPSADAPAATSTTKKYDIQSGIVTFSTTITGMGMTISGEDILYFDNFGMLERKDTYTNGQLEKSILTDGVDIYILQHADKTAYKSAKAVRGTEYRFDWNEIAQSERDNGNAKKLSNLTLAGKDCEAYSLTTKAPAATTEFAGWNHICMMTKSNADGMVNTIKATKVEENAAVAADKFKVPAGYKLMN